MKRPLRSVFLGNPRYLSAYALGVGQAMGLLGYWHRPISLFDDAASVARQIAEMAPDVIWTHMALWPPDGALRVEQIAELLTTWRRRGAAIYLHDGDPRERAVPVDVGSVFSIALVNRATETLPWGIPSLRWPYGAMVKTDSAAVMAPAKVQPKGDLTVEEQGHVRAALKFLRARHGWLTLAKGLRYQEKTLKDVAYGRLATAGIAVRLARFAGVGVDDLLAGKYPPLCPHCGQRMPSCPK